MYNEFVQFKKYIILAHFYQFDEVRCRQKKFDYFTNVPKLYFFSTILQNLPRRLFFGLRFLTIHLFPNGQYNYKTKFVRKHGHF